MRVLRGCIAVACFLLSAVSASGTTPGYPPQILAVSVQGGEADPFDGGCPFDPSAGVRGTRFVSICQPGFYESTGPYQIGISRSPFHAMSVIAEDPMFLAEPTISPDGRWVAFDVISQPATAEVKVDLNVVRSDGTDRHVLAAGRYSATWASDSRRLLARNDLTGNLDLIDLNGRAKRFALGLSAAWQPHGRLVAYEGPGGRLIVQRDDGKQRRVFGPVQQDSIAWSPDGRVLAYESDSTRFSEGLVTWNRHTHKTRLLAAQSPVRAAWSPDGRSLAVVSSPYTSSVGYALYVVPRNGGRVRLVFDPGGRSIVRVSWLANGRLVFVLTP